MQQRCRSKDLTPDIAVEARGKVGDDEKGDFILNFLSARGLDVSHVSGAKPLAETMRMEEKYGFEALTDIE